MKKFTWGTGIFLFLVLFLAASAAFIVFAARQQVNLVHQDYYEKGVDYSDQMRVNARSKPFLKALKTNSESDFFIVEIHESLSEKIDSGTVLMFRPSDKTKDIAARLTANAARLEFDKRALINGRYILKFTWYSDGLKYEIDQPVNVQ
jgi:hypothetical protein